MKTVCMQLKLDHDIIINEKTRAWIKNFKYTLCTVNDIKKFARNNKIISVGDVTTENLENNSINIFLEVVDLKTQRENKNFKPAAAASWANGPDIIEELNPPQLPGLTVWRFQLYKISI